jgi:hypothetical protein
VINKKIMGELKKKKTLPTIYKLINDTRKEYGNLLTKEDAAIILAGQLGIDPTKYIQKEELERIRHTPRQVKTIETKRKAESKNSELKIKNVPLGVPFIENKVIQDCNKMSEVYQLFYLFENSIRLFISSTLQSIYNSDDWWEKSVPKKVKDNVETRKKDEDENRWHARRGAHNIYYTTFGDLKAIITENNKNWAVFRSYFPNQTWIASRLSELELSRNIIAHNNPLPNDEINRIKLYFKDWIKQIKRD